MKKKQWYEIWILSKPSKQMELVAKVKSEGLAYIVSEAISKYYEMVEIR